MSDSESRLADALAAASTRNGQCTMEVFNRTPSPWNAVVIEIGATFFFQDSSGNEIGREIRQKRANIRAGESDSVVTTDANACVRQVFYAATVRMNGQDAMLTGRHSTDAKRCLIYCPTSIVPKSAISALGSDISDYFELKFDSTSAG